MQYVSFWLPDLKDDTIANHFEIHKDSIGATKGMATGMEMMRKLIPTEYL